MLEDGDASEAADAALPQGPGSPANVMYSTNSRPHMAELETREPALKYAFEETVAQDLAPCKVCTCLVRCHFAWRHSHCQLSDCCTGSA